MLTPKHVQKHAQELIATWQKCGRTGLTANVLAKFLRTPTAVVCKAMIDDKANFSPFFCHNLKAIIWVTSSSAFYSGNLYGNDETGAPFTRESAGARALEDCKKYGRTPFRHHDGYTVAKPEAAVPDPESISWVVDRLKTRGTVFIPEKTISDENCPYCAGRSDDRSKEVKA